MNRTFYAVSHILRNGTPIPAQFCHWAPPRSFSIDGVEIGASSVSCFPAGAKKPYPRVEILAGRGRYELVLRTEEIAPV